MNEDHHKTNQCSARRIFNVFVSFTLSGSVPSLGEVEEGQAHFTAAFIAQMHISPAAILNMAAPSTTY